MLSVLARFFASRFGGWVLAAGIAAAAWFVFDVQSARHAVEVAGLKGRLAVLQTEASAREAADAAAEASAREAAEAAANNENVASELHGVIANGPIIDGCVSRDFLRGLRKLR